MEVQKAKVIPLHTDWKYLDVCCDLINEEWPRSTTARMHSLESSCDNLPTSLILILIEIEQEETVIGHSKITPLHKTPNGCFVESVVIAKKFRGKGWGRYIMSETEKYAKLKGKSVIYLSTSDKQDFYEKLGYTVCEPVSVYGGKSIELKNNFILSFISKTNLSCSKGTQQRPAAAPPPPPPPPKPSSVVPKKVYMRKLIS